MKTFEEKYTAWVDGNLPGGSVAAFEKELEGVSTASADRAEVHRLGALLRSHGHAPPLNNAEFFSEEIFRRIRAQEPLAAKSAATGWWRWSIPQLASTGAICLLIAFALFKMLVPSATPGKAAPAPYFAEVVDVWPADPSISATTVYSPQDNVTVLWLDGLDYLPASYSLQ